MIKVHKECKTDEQWTIEYSMIENKFKLCHRPKIWFYYGDIVIEYCPVCGQLLSWRDVKKEE